MSEVVTGPVPLPDEGQYIIEITQRMFIKKFVDYFQDNLPQPFRVDTASNQMEEDLREGDLLVACMVKTVLVMRARKQDSGEMVAIPKNSAINFALLPKDTHEVRLGASWEGTFTVAEMIRLTLLPPAAKVLSDCKNRDKKKVSKGTILYNLTTFTTKVLKKRGIKGVSSFGVVHAFMEGENVQFSTKQLDTKCNLAEIYDIFKAPLKARVFCDGGTQLNHNDVVVFEEKEERTFLVVDTLNSQEPSSNVFSIPTDLTGVQVTAVRIRTDVRDESPPPEFEELVYSSVYKLSNETARPVSVESLESGIYKQMKVSPPSNTTDYPNRTRRLSEDIRKALYYSRPVYSLTSTTGDPHFPSRESEDVVYEIIGTVTKPPPKPPVKPKPQIEPPKDPRFEVTPTNLQLLHHVARHTGYQWRLFCAFLELEELSLDEADHKGISLREKCYEALLLWLQGEGKEPKWWTTILQALRKSDLTRVALDIQHHIMSGTPDEPGHEAELEKLCWIPFSIQSLTIRQKGGLFPLQPQSRELSEDHDVIMLEVPENAVNTAVCDRLCIRYGVIIYGPFDVPEGYQLGSMAVYIYFEEDHAVKPVLLHLPHWAGKDGESSLKCAIAPHRLEEGEEKYKFRLTEDGDFHSTEGSGVIAIDGHCSLYAKAFRQGASLLYYATGLEREIEERTILEVVVTFASQVWLQILKKNGVSSSKQCHTLFEFGESPIKGILSSTQGKGWSASMRGRSTVPREYVEYKSHGIEDAKDMERAVMNRSYPPFLSCQTTYSKEVKRTGRPTTVGLVIRGAKDGADLIFPCTTYEDRSAEGDREHPFQITPPPSPAINGDSNGCFHNPTSHNFDLNALTEHVVRHVAADWYRLGLYLGVEARVLDTVLADRSRDSSKACITMLGKWLNGAPGTGCKQREWSTILEAVGEAIGTEVQRFISNNLNPIMTSQQRAE